MPQWDHYAFITVGQILSELKEDGYPISRPTFDKLYKEGYFIGGRTVGKWRRFERRDVNVIKRIIKEDYYGITDEG